MTDEQVKLIGYWIDTIESCMKDNDFQRDFFESLYEQYVRKKFLSEKQLGCLQNIYERVTQQNEVYGKIR